MDVNCNKSKSNETNVEDTELDSMVTRKDPDVEIKSKGNTKVYFKSPTGIIWLSLKFVLIALLILLIGFVIVLILLGLSYQKKSDSYINSNPIDNQTAWGNCEKLASKLNKCFTKPQCQNKNSKFLRLNSSIFVKDLRLPLDIIPSFYNLTLHPHIHLSDPNQFYFNGSVEIIVQVKSPTDTIKIHSYRLLVNESLVKIRDSNDLELTIRNLTYDNQRQWFLIELAEMLAKDSDVKIVFPQFKGSLKPTHDLKGLYLSSYRENGVTKYLATSQLQPTDARMVFPCFDEPSFKAKFQVSIVRLKHYHALANMELLKTKTGFDNWEIDEFKPTVVTSTYLLAFVISEFKGLHGKDSKGRKFSVWSRPDVIHTANYSLNIGIKILEFFEKYFEIEYPLNKTDMVAVPDFNAGAMENWGLMIYREITMLWDDKYGNAEGRQKVATVVSHEIAHQWFGNLVTLKWWDDLWLNEGFASYVEYIGVSLAHPDWDMNEQFVLNELQKVLVADSMIDSHPVQKIVNHPNEINEIFDSISYNKGASVLRMMQGFLGKETFRKGIKNYLDTYKYRNTLYNDLWRSLTEQATRDGKNIQVKPIMDTWIKQMGYPLVTITKVKGNVFRADQEHFLIYSNSEDVNVTSPFNFTWVVPLTYSTKSSPRWEATERVVWLTNKSMEFPLEGYSDEDWYIFNLKQFGFYRVHYSLENWNQIVDQLLREHEKIPVTNRAQIIDDLFNLGKVDKVNYSLVMNLTRYLRREQSFIPWEAANRIFAYIESMLDTDVYFGDLQRYFCHLIDPIYRKVDWQSTDESTDHIKNLMRPLAVNIACNARHPQCINKARQLFEEFVKSNDSSKIPSSLRPIVFCVGIQYSGLKEWQFLFSKLERETRDSEISSIIKGLSCSREPWILKKFIMKILSRDYVKNNIINEMLSGLNMNPTGKYVFSDFLWSNYRNYTNSSIMIYIARIYSKRCIKPAECMTIEELYKLRDMAVEFGLILTDKDFSQAVEQVKQNQMFIQNYREPIGQWLKQYQLQINSDFDY